MSTKTKTDPYATLGQLPEHRATDPVPQSLHQVPTELQRPNIEVHDENGRVIAKAKGSLVRRNR